ncbi:MAG: DUF4142 domain-containing protein [Bacteroidota bacterium]
MKNAATLCACSALLLFGLAAGCKKDEEDKLNQTDRNFMLQAGYANNAEVDAGSLAANKATDASVKSFGSMMVSEHTTAVNELKSLSSATNVNVPSSPDSTHIAIKNMLAGMSDRAFDSAYMRTQVTDHAATIALMQNEISNGKDAGVKGYASKYLPHVQHHKHLADSIVAAKGF